MKIGLIPPSVEFNNNEIFRLNSKHNIDNRLFPYYLLMTQIPLIYLIIQVCSTKGNLQL